MMVLKILLLICLLVFEAIAALLQLFYISELTRVNGAFAFLVPAALIAGAAAVILLILHLSVWDDGGAARRARPAQKKRKKSALVKALIALLVILILAGGYLLYNFIVYHTFMPPYISAFFDAFNGYKTTP